MRRDSTGHVAEYLATRLVAHVEEQEVVHLEALRQNAAEALRNDSTVEICWIDPSLLPPGCSIAATYEAARIPARIRVARDASSGRRHFSVLHEYAHHLRNQVPEVLEALFDAPHGGAQLEERVCDEFAAQVLLPQTTVESALGHGVSARAVLNLIHTSSASAQACAVAAARYLPAPGYVVLLGYRGEVLFAARSGDALPVTRGTTQEGLLGRAREGIALRGRTHVTYASGNNGPEMFVDIAAIGSQRVAVLVTDSPPWGDLALAGTTYEPPAPAVCEHCDDEFVSYDPSCRACGQRVCPECRRCACEPLSTKNERRCDICFLTLPPAAFANGIVANCKNCA